ncbi:MAG: 2-oxoglutarate dehydrogenase E1 component [Chitinophagales bacterium]
MTSNYSYLSNAHPAYIESLYKDYQQNKEAIDSDWRKFFEGFDYAVVSANGNGTATNTSKAVETPTKEVDFSLLDELKVYNLIQAYRAKGHLESDTNPIRERKDRNARLKLEDFGLTNADLNKNFTISSEIGLKNATLQNIVSHLRTVYCGSIGLEFMHNTNPKVTQWFIDRFENKTNGYGFDTHTKKHILRKLNQTVVFEQFLHTKYVGQKRFSLEGGESTIPAIDAMIHEAASTGAEEIIIGMAHRGRLNVLANILGKTYEQIFSEFEGKFPELTMGDGDVKYHLGYSSQVDTHSGRRVYLKLAPNPSHLEAVNPVVEGYARAKADAIYDFDYDRLMPILIHGDAAVAGQGIVYEVVQMSELKGYYTGGTIHFIINNQIGFTTDFDDARSANYSTDVGKIVQAPVIHVNGDDVEAVVYAAKVATAYRQEFNKDIFVDMVCYRKHGHNEGDDPKFTQPIMYKLIAKHDNPRDLYSKKLAAANEVDAVLAKRMDQEFRQLLQERLDMVRNEKPLPYKYQESELAWRELRHTIDPEDFHYSPSTNISQERFNTIFEGITGVPADFKVLKKVQKLLDARKEMVANNGLLDWATAELMAYGSILLEGHNVRMSGQDVKRGTFSHRHAILSEPTGREHNLLSDLAEEQGRFLIYNSFLSEFAVLGFEFGYSMASPSSLTLWEAQFGDFVNGAQTMIDQFITSSESKWGRMSGLVMLLPHGYEGQGPEHSSAKLERFLQACAEFNISVVNITEPANFFHALRRQQHRPFRKPLVVMSPKSLLRHAKCVSPIADFVNEGANFKEIIDDPTIQDAEKVRKVVLCSGKIYYDLLNYQEENNIQDIAVVRLEQLYPFPQKQLDAIFEKYKNASVTWTQEEPKNMGAWSFILYHMPQKNMQVVSRKESASPATGYASVHKQQQLDIVEKSFA